MYSRALAGYEKVLGPNHVRTLNTINKLGGVYRQGGRPDEVEQMYLQALVGWESVLGRDHLSTVTTAKSLCTLYHQEGKFDQAEQMYVRSLAGEVKALDRPMMLCCQEEKADTDAGRVQRPFQPRQSS